MHHFIDIKKLSKWFAVLSILKQYNISMAHKKLIIYLSICIQVALFNITISPNLLAQDDTKHANVFNQYFKALLAQQNYDFNRSTDYLLTLHKQSLLPEGTAIPLLRSLILAGKLHEATILSKDIKEFSDYEAVYARTLLVSKALRTNDYQAAKELVDSKAWINSHDILRIFSQAWVLAALGDEEATDTLQPLAHDASLKYMLPPLKASIELFMKQPARAYQTLKDSVGGELMRLGTIEMELLIRAALLSGQQDTILNTLGRYIELGKGNAFLLRDYLQFESKKTLPQLIVKPEHGLAHSIALLGIVIYQNAPLIRLQLLRLSQQDVPNRDSILLNVASTLSDIDQYEQSNQELQLIHETSLLHLNANILKADNLYSIGQQKKALNLLLSLKKKHPGNRIILLKLGFMFRANQQYQKVIELFDEAIANAGQLLPADWNLYYNRGIAWHLLNNWKMAEKDMQEALKLNPTSASVLNYLGYSWIDMNINIDKAFNMIKQAVAIRKNDGAIVDSLGWAYYRQAHYVKAVQNLERAVQLLPNDPVISDHLGDAYWQLKRKYEAQFQWKRALQLDPEDSLRNAIIQKLKNGLKL